MVSGCNRPVSVLRVSTKRTFSDKLDRMKGCTVRSNVLRQSRPNNFIAANFSTEFHKLMIFIVLHRIEPLLPLQLIQMRLTKREHLLRGLNAIGGASRTNSAVSINKERIWRSSVEVALVEIFEATIVNDALRRSDNNNCLQRRGQVTNIVAALFQFSDRSVAWARKVRLIASLDQFTSAIDAYLASCPIGRKWPIVAHQTFDWEKESTSLAFGQCRSKFFSATKTITSNKSIGGSQNTP